MHPSHAPGPTEFFTLLGGFFVVKLIVMRLFNQRAPRQRFRRQRY